MQKGKGQTIRLATYPSTTSIRQGHFCNIKDEENFWHSACCPTCLSAPQAGLWNPFHPVRRPTQLNEEYVVKWTAVSPADGNESLWPTWQFFRCTLLKVTQNQKLYSCKSLLVAARHMLNQPAAPRASSSLPGLQQTAGSAVLNITVMRKLDSVNERTHAICYFLNVLVTKSHISIKRERTFLMLPFSHSSRISLNRHFLQSYVTVRTARLILIWADIASTV